MRLVEESETHVVVRLLGLLNLLLSGRGGTSGSGGGLSGRGGGGESLGVGESLLDLEDDA